MKVLVYSRPPVLSEFSFIAEHAFPDAERLIMSEALRVDQSGLAEGFGRALAKGNGGEHRWSAEELEDIRFRDRLLRSLPKARALELMAAMTTALDTALERARPDVILSTSVDSYVLDILGRLARKRGILFLGVIGSFVRGCFRLTERGEFVTARDPADQEVEAVLDKLLQRDYTPTYMMPSQGNLRRIAFRRWLEDIARFGYFGARRVLIPSERYYHHAWLSQTVVRERLHFPPSCDGSDPEWRRRLAATSPARLFYLPLQYFPEATIDYWCPDHTVIDYLPRTVEFARELARHGTVIVKEHPSFCGMRTPAFYRDLASIDGVLIAPARELSNDLVAQSDFTVVWTGTVGFEAALKGKPVIALGSPYYACGRHIADHAWGGDLEQTIEGLEAQCREPPTRSEQLAMVRHVLSGTLTGILKNNGRFNVEDPEHAAGARRAAEALRDYVAHRASAGETSRVKGPMHHTS